MSPGFLSRWSRLKQEGRPDAPQADARQETPSGPAPETIGASEAIAGAPSEAPLSPEEVAALPPPDQLTLESDLKPFLRLGVPEALRNAALRRMWSLDPAIRDFVGPARDYAYDWSVPGGVPGSGPLAPGTDVTAMARRILGESEAPAARGVPSHAEESDSPKRDEDTSAPSGPVPATSAAQHSAGPSAGHTPEGKEPQRTADEPRTADSFAATHPETDPARSPARRHGGAKPF